MIEIRDVRIEDAEAIAAILKSLSGILCVGHNMRSADAPKIEIVDVWSATGADSL